LSEAIEEMLDRKVEEIGPVEFLKQIGKGVFDLLGLMSEVANSREDVQSELSGWDRVIQFKAPGTRPCHLTIAGGKMKARAGEAKRAELIFETNSSEELMGMLTGVMDGTQMYMAGRLIIKGQLSDANKFEAIGQLLQQALTNQKIMEIWKLSPEVVAKKLGLMT
jgi:putative sterol carrier protein